jgi:hypothetical protein
MGFFNQDYFYTSKARSNNHMYENPVHNEAYGDRNNYAWPETDSKNYRSERKNQKHPPKAKGTQ